MKRVITRCGFASTFRSFRDVRYPTRVKHRCKKGNHSVNHTIRPFREEEKNEESGYVDFRYL